MTLDLTDVDPAIWRVLIQSTAYGPYTLGQLQSFIGEGRVGAQTKVAKGDGAPFIEAETMPELQNAFHEKAFVQHKRRDSDKSDKPNNYIVMSRLTGMGESELVRHLNSHGSFGEAMPGIYILRSKVKLGKLQQSLKAITTARDKILIVNATSNRLGWFNLGPEADVHLQSIWDKELD